jgi:hypothetical protein
VLALDYFLSAPAASNLRGDSSRDWITYLLIYKAIIDRKASETLYTEKAVVSFCVASYFLWEINQPQVLTKDKTQNTSLVFLNFEVKIKGSARGYLNLDSSKRQQCADLHQLNQNICDTKV